MSQIMFNYEALTCLNETTEVVGDSNTETRLLTGPSLQEQIKLLPK